eukprot:scaffold131982_cov40-Tisochrysis_lutea.AAC.1
MMEGCRARGGPPRWGRDEETGGVRPKGRLRMEEWVAPARGTRKGRERGRVAPARDKKGERKRSAGDVPESRAS